MSKKIIFAVIVILALGALFYSFKRSYPVTNYPPQGETIVAFGDSLVEGVGATKGNDFPSLLAKLIGEPIINMGTSGNTSADGLQGINSVNAKNPKIVMVLFGGNDFLRKVPAEQTFKNIDEIVVGLQNEGAVVVLLGVKGGLLSDQYEERFAEIARARGALYVPNVLAGILGNTQFMGDSIHPNDAGYKKIAEKIYPVLKKAF
jgi:lysophospholipase L1-like esterase